MDLGLYYYQARFYVPGIGRFASADSIIPDPANPQSYNRYSYVRNNPLNGIDPTGHVDCNLLGAPEDVAACEDAKNAGTFSMPCGDCGYSSAYGNLGAAYEVFVELEEILERPVTYAEILAFVINEEYGTSGLSQHDFALSNEATGRLFYYFCGSDGVCRNDELWKFFGYHDTWTGADPKYIARLLTQPGGIPEHVWGAVQNILNQSHFDASQATEEQLLSNWRSGLPKDEDGVTYPVPFHYGNYSLYSSTAQAEFPHAPLGIARNALLVNRADLEYFVMTQGQKNYWNAR